MTNERRDEVIDILDDWYGHVWCEEKYAAQTEACTTCDEKWEPALRDAVTALRSEPAAGPWVRVEEGLPELREDVLLWCDGEPCCGWLSSGPRWFSLHGETVTPTHWVRITPPRSAR